MVEQGTNQGLIDQILASDHASKMDPHNRRDYRRRLEAMSVANLDQELTTAHNQP